MKMKIHCKEKLEHDEGTWCFWVLIDRQGCALAKTGEKVTKVHDIVHGKNYCA